MHGAWAAGAAVSPETGTTWTSAARDVWMYPAAQLQVRSPWPGSVSAAVPPFLLLRCSIRGASVPASLQLQLSHSRTSQCVDVGAGLSRGRFHVSPARDDDLKHPPVVELPIAYDREHPRSARQDDVLLVGSSFDMAVAGDDGQAGFRDSRYPLLIWRCGVLHDAWRQRLPSPSAYPVIAAEGDITPRPRKDVSKTESVGVDIPAGPRHRLGRFAPLEC